MVLADFGADVIAIERPGGDPFRDAPSSAVWLRGKRSVTLDLRSEEGRTRLRALAAGADVAVAAAAPGTMARLGADHAALSAENPRLVYCSITGFGPRGPLAGYRGRESVVAARVGRMQTLAGVARREGPTYAASPVGRHAAAQGAVAGILAALVERERSGLGQLVETSLLQGVQLYDIHGLLLRQLARRDPATYGPDTALGAAEGMPQLFYQPVQTADGRWMQLGNLIERLFRSYLAATGLGELGAEPRFAGPPNAIAPGPKEELRRAMLERMRERSADEWMPPFISDGNIAAELYATTQQALDHPDLVANEQVLTREHPRLGALRQPGVLATLDATPGAVGAPSPEAGADTSAVLAALDDGAAPWQAPALPDTSAPAAERPDRAPSEAGAGPLDGVLVLDLASVIAGPLASSVLADMGARVIKVEPPGGDPFRAFRGGISTGKTTAGKESVCLDLKQPRGRELLQALVGRADVLIHNNRPGASERIGIGYEELAARNPRLVYVWSAAYGSRGPSAKRPGAHPIPGAAIGGALHQAGPAMPPPTNGSAASVEELIEVGRWLHAANEPSPDPITSAVVVAATLLGLWARERTGRGQRVETSMLAASAYAQGDDFLDYAGKPPRRPLDAELLGIGALERLYRTREGWLLLSCHGEGEWQARLGALAGEPGGDALAADARFASAEARERHDAELADALAPILEGRDAEEWELRLATAGVGAAQADRGTVADFCEEHAHALEGGFARPVEHPRYGKVLRYGPLVDFARTPALCGPPALAGQHSDALLAELGVSAREIAELRAAGVVWSEAP
jgi:crotonobetainyl-CoA:carnitine CoA-transferase CaiB-like acyl-CoA transferase